MIFVVYGKKDKFVWKQFQGSIKTIVPENKIEVMNSKEALAQRLSQVSCGDAIVVIITTDRQELLYFYSIIHLLRKARVILVIPDLKAETVRIGYRLEPRFLSSGAEDFSEVRAVLRNMLEGDKLKVAMN